MNTNKYGIMLPKHLKLGILTEIEPLNIIDTKKIQRK